MHSTYSMATSAFRAFARTLVFLATACPGLVAADECSAPTTTAPKSAGLGLPMPAPADLWVSNGRDGVDDPQACGTSPDTPCLYPWQAVRRAGPGTVVHLAATSKPYNTILIDHLKGEELKPIVIMGDGVAPNRTRVIGRVEYVDAGGNRVVTDDAAIVVIGSPFYAKSKRDDPAAPSVYNHDPAQSACVAYITIKNLDIQGGNPVGDSTVPLAVPFYGISVYNAHHITVEGNYLHESPGGGVGSQASDWLVINGNTVRGNARNVTACIFTSGISLFRGKDSHSDLRGSRNYVVANRVYENTNVWNPLQCQGLDAQGKPLTANSDGNGIIVDDMRWFQDLPGDKKLAPYQGQTSIYNNIVWGNGGRGIHVFSSDNVSIYSNTVYHNQTDTHNGAIYQSEIMANDSGGVGIWSNIAVADGLLDAWEGRSHYSITVGSLTPAQQGGSPNFVQYNIVWNDAGNVDLAAYIPQIGNPVYVDSNKILDPLLSSPQKPAGPGRAPLPGARMGADLPGFKVRAGSPALNNRKYDPGYPASGGLSSFMYAEVDILGISRSPDVTFGAYQTFLPASALARHRPQLVSSRASAAVLVHR